MKTIGLFGYTVPVRWLWGVLLAQLIFSLLGFKHGDPITGWTCLFFLACTAGLIYANGFFSFM